MSFNKFVKEISGMDLIEVKDYKEGRIKEEFKKRPYLRACCRYSEDAIIYKNEGTHLNQVIYHELGHALLHGMEAKVVYGDTVPTAKFHREYEAELFAKITAMLIDGEYIDYLALERQPDGSLVPSSYLNYYRDWATENMDYMLSFNYVKKRFYYFMARITNYCKDYEIDYDTTLVEKIMEEEEEIFAKALTYSES